MERDIAKAKYYKMLIECYEAAINRLDPLLPMFEHNFSELFRNHTEATEKYNNAIKEVELLKREEIKKAPVIRPSII